MTAELKGGKELSKRLHAIGDGRKLLGRLQIQTTYEAKKLVPRKTGNLGRSIGPGALSSREAFVKASAAYAAYVEKGTKPHIIRAKNGRALRFPASGVSTTLAGRVRSGEVKRLGAGAYVFRSEVHHPGTKPKPFLLPGAKKAATSAGLGELVIELWNKAA